MHEVRDGSRILRFEGTLLGESSSWQQGSYRWIEFELYRTESGSYVLSRVGVSLIFHGAACPLVTRYNLTEVSSDDLYDDAVPCEECQPTFDLPVVFPEKYRNWVQVSEDPEAVLSAVYREDKSGSKYLTKVAKRLLEEASDNDSRIEAIYRVELIP